MATAPDRAVEYEQGGRAESMLAKGPRRMGQGDELGGELAEVLELPPHKVAMQKAPLNPRWIDGRQRWSATRAGRFRYAQHINLSEADALQLGIRDVPRHPEAHDHRLLAFVDSQVVVGATAKGRRGSRTRMAKVRIIKALCLAGRLDLGSKYIKSADNPADEPSRRRR